MKYSTFATLLATLRTVTLACDSYRNMASFLAKLRRFSTTSVARNQPIGFVGLGNMGAHMARNLVKAGHRVIVHDKESAPVEELRQSGAEVATNPAHVAEQSKHVITMLPSSPHVREVYAGENGIFKSLHSGSLLIDSSTIDPAVTKEMGAMATEKGARMVDAPVSGGITAARDALLTFIVGGSKDAFEDAEKLLKLMGKNVFHCGSLGAGQAVKLCNNLMLGITMFGTAEVMNLGMRLGLDPKLLADVINVSSGQSWSSLKYNPVPGVLDGIPSSNNYQGGFASKLMLKDLGLALNAAKDTSSATPLGSLAMQLYQIMCDQGFDSKDFSSAYQFISKKERV
ncbi:probable 3-hydroxyisobutyrate dehydrogenase, mitochondrial [Oscarella lobularis]|uniref:probable 3-hydroxyisobutyrate dehydrogenase, mitochondrial n=1 Tax=Oscarella lobularis TaxID=121494 RepID=UPI003313A5E2